MNGWRIDVHGHMHRDLANDLDSDLHRHNPPHTKRSHPYSYDPFTVYGGPNTGANGSVYTDRLWQWDHGKTQRIGKEVFEDGGDFHWFGSSLRPGKVQAFLRRWNDDESIVLTRVVEYCNASTGYPTWLLVYRTDKR